MRCSEGKQGCGSRFTLRQHPKLYARAVRCPHCKSLVTNSVEKARRAEANNAGTCHCHMYPFPHRVGSLRMCLLNTNAHKPTEEEIQDYYGCLETPRSGTA